MMMMGWTLLLRGYSPSVNNCCCCPESSALVFCSPAIKFFNLSQLFHFFLPCIYIRTSFLFLSIAVPWLYIRELKLNKRINIEFEIIIFKQFSSSFFIFPHQLTHAARQWTYHFLLHIYDFANICFYVVKCYAWRSGDFQHPIQF